MKEDFSTGRDTYTIVSWVKKRTGISSNKINSCDELASKLEHRLTAVYFGDLQSTRFEVFMRAAQQAEKYEFYHTESLCPHLNGGHTEPSISVHRNFDKSPVHFEGALNYPDLAGWLEEQSWPQIIEFSEESVDIIFGNGRRNALILFVNQRDHDFVESFEEAANRKVGDAMYVLSGTQDGV